MTTFAAKIADAWTVLPVGQPVTLNEISVSWETLMLWSDEEREPFGVFRVVDPDAPPAGKVEASRALKPDGERPEWVVAYVDAPVPDLDAVKAARAAEVTALSEEHVAAGYVHDFGGATGPKTLQTRDEDKPNWLALMATAQALVIMGQGAAPCGEIRTLDNARVPVTAAQAQGVMLGMQGALSARMKRGWDLKDAIRDAPDVASVQAIDITAGWPA